MAGDTVMVAWVTGGAVILSSAVTSALAFAGGRKNGQAAFIKATAEAADLVIGQLRAEIARITALWEKAEARYAEATVKLEAAVADRITSDANEERCREELEELRDRFDAMIAEEPVLPYRPSDLRRVGPKD